MNDGKHFKYSIIGAIWMWLGLFAVIPILFVLIVSFLTHDPDHFFKYVPTLQNYFQLFQFIYLKVFLRSLILAAVTTFLCLIIGYPVAFLLTRLDPQIKPLLLLLVIIPFWTSSLLRTYAIVILFETNGLLNHLLLSLHLIKTPLSILYTNIAVLIGLTYNLLPFMILPIYSHLEKLDQRLLDASADLGATHWQTFYKVLLPLSVPGIMSGTMLVFLPAMTLFFIPDLLGGAKSLLLGNLIQLEFLEAQNWPKGSAVSIALTLLMLALLLFYQRLVKRKERKLLI